MKYLVIVNGKPGSGKTTFETECQKYLELNDLAYGMMVSSIDHIKDIYRMLGWNGMKTVKARKDLHTLKQMWIDTCDGPTKFITKHMLDLDDRDDYVVFTDIREESEIIKLAEVMDVLSIMDMRCTTVFISRPDNDGIEHGNKSDDMVGSNMSIYEHIIVNDGDIRQFREMACEFIKSLMEEE